LLGNVETRGKLLERLWDPARKSFFKPAAVGVPTASATGREKLSCRIPERSSTCRASTFPSKSAAPASCDPPHCVLSGSFSTNWRKFVCGSPADSAVHYSSAKCRTPSRHTNTRRLRVTRFDTSRALRNFPRLHLRPQFKHPPRLRVSPPPMAVSPSQNAFRITSPSEKAFGLRNINPCGPTTKVSRIKKRDGCHTRTGVPPPHPPSITNSRSQLHIPNRLTDSGRRSADGFRMPGFSRKCPSTDRPLKSDRCKKKMGRYRAEPATPSVSCWCSSQLS